MARLMEGPKRLRRCTLQSPGATPPAGTGVRSIHRTAVYGPVCTVVWEGRSRETPPYPDFQLLASRLRRGSLACIGKTKWPGAGPAMAIANGKRLSIRCQE